MDDLLNIARSAAKEAGDEIMKIYARDFSARDKEDGTPVTEADDRAHDVVLEILGKTNIPILSEEDKEVANRPEKERVWIVDPIDGTRDFIERTGEFVVMIALVEKRTPILGVVVVPALGYELYATKGGGAWRVEKDKEPEKISVSKIDFMEQATLVVSRSHFSDEIQKLITGLSPGNQHKVGSNGIKIGLVAEGKADAFFNPTDRMGEWDTAAPHIILTEAGGKVTDMEGNDLIYNKKEPRLLKGVIATNSRLSDRIMNVYRSES